MKSTLRTAALAIVATAALHHLAYATLPSRASAGASRDATPTFDTCSWDHPGVEPFMGDVVGAVDRYQDIPPDVRGRLKARMAKRDYDDIVSIRRDSISGNAHYANEISEMHFASGEVCRSVTRTSWTPQMEERGLVYCDSGECILVPTVCRNVSRITRREVGNELALGPTPAVPGALPAAPGAVPSMDDAMAATPLDDYPPTGAGIASSGPSGPIGSAESFAAAAPQANLYGAPGAGGVYLAPAGGPGRVVPAGPPVSVIPEPETWALMLCGLGALAAHAYRRRAQRGARPAAAAPPRRQASSGFR